MQDTIVLGSLSLPNILSFSKEIEFANKKMPFGAARYGGIHVGKSAYGPTILTLDGVYVETGTLTGDTLDNNFDTYIQSIISHCAETERKLYLQATWFYEVRFFDYSEHEREYGNVKYSVKFSCERGRRFSDTETSATKSSGQTLNVTSEAPTPVYIDIATTNGNTYTISDGTNTVTIVATATGTATLDTERNMLWRGTTPAQSEMKGISPLFVPGVATTITLTGVASVTTRYRAAKL